MTNEYKLCLKLKNKNDWSSFNYWSRRESE